MLHAPSTHAKELELNEDDARWACSWALSRETGGKYGGYIYPLLDLANHASWTAGRSRAGGMHALSTNVPPESHGGVPVAQKGRGFVARRNMSVGEQVFDQCALHRPAMFITRPVLIHGVPLLSVLRGRRSRNSKCSADHPVRCEYDFSSAFALPLCIHLP